VFRREIIEHIEKFWRYAPDSFINLKANALGYRTVSRNVIIDSTVPSDWNSSKRMKFYGRKLYYVGNSFFIVLYISLKHMMRREHGLNILRGFLRAFLDGDEKCRDKDVRYHYSKRRALKRLYRRGVEGTLGYWSGRVSGLTRMASCLEDEEQ